MTPNCLPIVRVLVSKRLHTWLPRVVGDVQPRHGGERPNPKSRENREYRTLRGATDAAAEAAEGDGLLLLGDVVEEGNGALELPAVDGLGGFPRVLERDTEVRAAGAGRLGGRDLLGCVSNLQVVPESAITVRLLRFRGLRKKNLRMRDRSFDAENGQE